MQQRGESPALFSMELPMRSALTVIGLCALLLLAACGSGVATAPQAEPPTAPAESPAATTEPPTATAEPAPVTAVAPTTAPPTATAEQAAEPATFAIVPEESRVSYEVGEVFINQGNRYVVAVGVTQVISGELTLDRAAPENSSVGPITIDISAFQSDSERRDNAIRDQWLESRRFPLATFVPTEISGLPATYSEGEQLRLMITGDLTIRETTQPTTFIVEVALAGDELRGTATSDIKMSDFGFEAPNILNVLRAEDDVRLTFDFVARTAE